MLLGQRPFRGRSVQELAQQKQQARLSFEGRLRLPRGVRALLRRGLDPEPSRRLRSMMEVRDALERLRRPARPRRTAALAAVAVAATTGLGWALLWQPVPSPCEAGAAQIGEVWGDQARGRLERAFEATGLPYARDAAQRATARLDAYASEWAQGYATACHAAAGAAEASSLDLTMRCLGQARVSMGATVELLEHADAASVQRAVALVAGLPSLARCDDLEALGAEVAPPDDPGQAAAIEQVRQQLEEAAALDRAGHYAEGRTRAEQALARALELGYEPAIVRARIRLASLELGLGHAEASRRGLVEAALVAAGIGDHNAAADAATRLVFVLAEELGQPDEALQWARHAEASLGRLPADPLARARLDSSLGVIHAAKGDYEAALADFERAYEGKRAVLGQAHPEVAGALDNVALSHAELGRPARAEALQRRGVELLEQALGPRHPDLAHTLVNLGHSLGSLGRHDEALEAFQRALAIFREALGARHPMVARTLASLGHAAAALDRLHEAEAYFREAADIIVEVHGERHREHGWSLADRAQVLDRLGRHEEAAELFARAREILEASIGTSHDSVAYVMMSEATALVELGRAREAEPLVTDAGEILAARFGPEHPSQADWHASHAELLRAQGRLEDAREASTKAVDVATAALGSEHPAVGWFLVGLGEVELDLQRYEDARAHLRRALAIIEHAQVGPGMRGSVAFALARALWPDPATRTEALALARQAEAAFGRVGDVLDEDLAEVVAWLRDHPP